jgi:hypothetical protein
MATQNNVSISSILTIIQIALNALSVIPAVGADAALAGVFINILQAGMVAYNAAAGAPLDLSKIPLETPVA